MISIVKHRLHYTMFQNLYLPNKHGVLKKFIIKEMKCLYNVPFQEHKKDMFIKQGSKVRLFDVCVSCLTVP